MTLSGDCDPILCALGCDLSDPIIWIWACLKVVCILEWENNGTPLDSAGKMAMFKHVQTINKPFCGSFPLPFGEFEIV